MPKFSHGNTMELIKTTPEFKVLLALMEGPKSFSDLREATRLSSRWLSKTLDSLVKSRTVEKGDNRLYQLKSLEATRRILQQALNELNKSIGQSDSETDLHSKAVRAAELIAMNEKVLAIVLFGSVAKGRTDAESDIDFLVVTTEEMDLTDTLYSAMAEVDAPIEALTVSLKQFLVNLLDEPPTTFFGILEAYEALYDKFKVVDGLLRLKQIEIQKSWLYDSGQEIWLKRKSLPYSKQPETNS
jgi:predicted nucleotidyltransferase/DNA-binding HxlR family transcriptional regulator